MLSVLLISGKFDVSEHEQKRKLGFDSSESEVRMKRILKELEASIRHIVYGESLHVGMFRLHYSLGMVTNWETEKCLH